MIIYDPPPPPPTSKPVISPIQSVIGYLQWQAFEFQLTATQSPTKWYCTPLAPGLFFDDINGTILGAATMPGVYLFTVQAQNSVGVSDPVTFAMGIEASGFIQPSNIVELVIDLTTRIVSLGSATTQTAGSGSASQSEDSKLSPLFWVKAGDDLLLNIRSLKGGVPADLALTGLKFALKELEPENILVSGGDWTRVSAGDQASYRIFIHVDSDDLRSALTNYEDDQATQFLALGEFEWTEQNVYQPKVGPDIVRTSTRTFGVMLPRDLIPNS
jgi:hypothetical protein